MTLMYIFEFLLESCRAQQLYYWYYVFGGGGDFLNMFNFYWFMGGTFILLEQCFHFNKALVMKTYKRDFVNFLYKSINVICRETEERFSQWT